MGFNSYIFILVFLPLVFCLYYVLHGIWRPLGKVVLTLASIYFIYYADPRFLIFFAASILVNFIIAKFIYYDLGKAAMLAMGIILNTASLGVFKYTGFQNIIVPLGISFVTFSQIAFLVDCYNGKIEEIKFLDYVTFTLYFPKLVQGPISKYNQVMQQLDGTERKLPDGKKFATGIWFFAIGLGKKVLIADTLAGAVIFGYSFSGNFTALTGMEALITILCYTLQIYFDFSGYSHMAIGISNMLGIELIDNFDRPYIAVSVDDFWKRWHISLTDFLREYIYFPLGGSRKGKVRAYINVMIIFIVSGVWHGDDYTFLIWGIIHGIAMCINRFLEKHSKIKPNFITNIFGWICTFIYVNITWVFFRARTLTDAWQIIKRAISCRSYELSDEFLNQFAIQDLLYLEQKIDIFKKLIAKIPSANMLIIVGISMLIALLGKDRAKDFKPNPIKSMFIGLILLWSLISLSGVTQFIYGSF